jgi:FtsH-binding integral membrane protein
MLLVTSFAARINKAFETTTETVITFVLPFILLFPLNYYADIYPLNLILATAFSFNMGWMIAPGIIAIGEQFKWRRYIKNKGIVSKTVVTKKADWLERLYGTKDEKHFVYYYKSSPENTFEIKSDEYRKLKDDFNAEVVSKDPYNQEWQNVIFQAALGTTIAVFLAAGINYVSDTDFGFLGGILFIALSALVVMGLLNLFIYRSNALRLLYAYCGVVIFSLYLLYDFNLLEKHIAAGDESWGTAVRIAVRLYLDIINLFLDLLQILGEN